MTQESRPLFGFKQGKGCKTRQESKGGGGKIARRARRDGERIRKELGRYTNVNFTIKVAD